jgi:hypothetical protein
MSWIFVNSLGSTFLDLLVRVFLVRDSRILTLRLRGRGLIGIGSGVGWVSGMAGRRRGGGLGSAWPIEEGLQVET